MFGNLHFLYPNWLLLFIPLFVLVIYFLRKKDGAAKHAVEQLVDPALAPFVLTEKTKNNSKSLIWFFTLFTSLSILAIAGPSWKKVENASYQKQQALVILMDLSASMYANDIKPDRLTRARFELIDLLKHRKEGQTALIVYAGKPFTVSPLTDDVENIETQAKYLTPDDMPTQGSNLADAIDKALDLLKNTGFGEGQILVMTDEVRDTAASNQVIETAATQGYMTSFMALGTQEGAPVPLKGGGFLKDRAGNIVVPKANFTAMRKLAKTGNGIFVQSSVDDTDLNQLLPQIARSNKQENYKENEESGVMAWQNEGIWIVLLLLPFFLFFIFRRSVLLSLFLAGFLLSPTEELHAAEQSWWNNLWETPDQQAANALKNDNAEQAFQTFENPDWKATAAYRAGEYGKAAEIYAQQIQNAGNLYNLGNSQAMAGKYPEAIQSYERALQQDPSHEDAKHNLEAVKKHLQEQQQNGQPQNNQEQENQNQENQQDSQSSSQNGEGESSEQQQGEQGEPQQEQNQSQQQQGQSEQDQTQQDSAEESEASNGDTMTEEERQAREAAEKEQEALEQEMERVAAQSEENQEQQNPENNDEVPADLLSESEREQAQATQQWLRRIPDDPSGLWRRKFLYQYRQQGNQAAGTGEPW